MELFRTETHYIFVKDVTSLWWDRVSGAFTIKSAWDFSNIEDIECLGITDGIIGKVEHTNIYEPRLMIIKESAPVGQLYFQHTIYKVKSVCFLQLGSTNVDLELPICTKHGSNSGQVKTVKTPVGRLLESSVFLNKTLGVGKSAGHTIKNFTQQAASQVKLTVTKNKRDPKLTERLDKRLTDELYRVFDDSDSFYYSRTIDLSNSLQRQYDCETKLKEEDKTLSVTDVKRWWKFADDRFFWNKYMLRDIIALGSPHCDQWILPIIQGFIHLTQCSLESQQTNPMNVLISDGTQSSGTSGDDHFTLGLISRRSRYQAGTRYNRRGIEPCGKVANYVETEQIVSIICMNVIHRASYVQVRGSVPIYWSQPEAKFRPPLQIDKGEEETQIAFERHFKEENNLYGDVTIVNLVQQQGRERVIWEHYGKHVRMFNSPHLTYVTFDFHEYCRGMRYENVSILINGLTEIISDMKFCWRDDEGMICTQNGVFRVNCIDCLDRTNVVQTAIAKCVLDMQLCRLGVANSTSKTLHSAFLTMWADNGDTISRQYAGTKALKSDYTRTGERKITGLMKDGVNSANRYYLSTFKDALRQLAIDVMTGEFDSRDDPDNIITDTCDKDLAVDKEAMAQTIKNLIDDTKKQILPESVSALGAWGLIDADPLTSSPHEVDIDVILLLTSDKYYVADYDEPSDRILSVDTIPLADLTFIQLGTFAQNTNSLFQQKKPEGYCMRLHHTVNGVSGYFHTFRSTSLRFFNNMAVAVSSNEERAESLRSICESFQVARRVSDLKPVPFQDNVKLERIRSKERNRSSTSKNTRSSLMLDHITNLPSLTHNVSDSVKSAGTKAFTNMTEQFSKLNRLGHTFQKTKPALQLNFNSERTRKIFTLGQNRQNPTKLYKKGSLSDGMSSDYSSDDENRTNIFEPTLDNFENNQQYIGKSKTKQEENDCELIENPLYTSMHNDENLYLPNTEIVLNEIYKEASTCKTPSSGIKRNPFDNAYKPEIHIDAGCSQGDFEMKRVSPSEASSSCKLSNTSLEGNCSDSNRELPLNVGAAQKLSHSSIEVNLLSDQDSNKGDFLRSISQSDITSSITQSQSETALKHLASPISSTKDLVLSPFTKIAQGVQSLGANLDPRRIKSAGVVKQINEQQYEDHRKLLETWKDCNTRLIAL